MGTVQGILWVQYNYYGRQNNAPSQMPLFYLWNWWSLTPHGKQDLFEVIKVRPLNSEIILAY